MGQAFSFGFSDSLLAEVANVSLTQLHQDVQAILKAYEAIKPVARRLGVEPPVPHLPGFAYCHLAALGAKIVFPEGSEPKPEPLLKSAEEIDQLKEPEDYLAAPLIQQRLKLAEELKARCPQAYSSIGHLYEGPVTTAMLLLGEKFLFLLYDEPDRARRLLDFCVRSALNYAQSILKFQGVSLEPGPKGIPDDFAGLLPPGLFEEFVVPYWEKIYQGLLATDRHLHSELLRKEHLDFLRVAKITCFDPSADQYLTPEILKKHCPCRFNLSILSWHIHDLTEDQLENFYLKLASFQPEVISFHLSSLREETKIRRLLKVARENQ
ncbi:MAG: hypothetical protein NC911_04620 [Candidatus Omnitrophica bacterium]|nr:hypothetical protein [Candidatus Omnitrophota bacterium]MCM8768946.1 hypothetical protein [Candidatus Omnitrophota bacterium]